MVAMDFMAAGAVATFTTILQCVCARVCMCVCQRVFSHAYDLPLISVCCQCAGVVMSICV